MAEIRVVLAPDKFKGCLPAVGVAEALAAGVRSVRPDAELVLLPVADGGDGTVAAALAAGHREVVVTVEGPTGEPVRAPYAVRGDDAVVELAGACGLDLLPGGRPAPLTASTYGLGQVLRHALEHGARRVVLGLGGSASTDGGAGLVQALGARLLDADGVELDRGGAALADLASLDLGGLVPLDDVDVVVASDVDHPLLGSRGAAAVFGPQKGADAEQVARLDAALARWADVVGDATGSDLREALGAGAAGGTGFAALALLGATLRPGIELVLDLVGFADAAQGASLVVTGEGSLDEQSLAGKAPVGVAAAAGRAGVRTVAVAGRSLLEPGHAAAAGVSAVYPLSDLEPDPARSIAHAAELLEQVGARIAEEWLDGEPTADEDTEEER
ncbi:glycerate kinase [Microlunatus flavus]|uniref:Glycerate kinase n=1 Tax=Microlunatus flavus TaxID=1036181 RepID=A0A1H9K2I0_9ACTN|nr:glycerate kinase [Microlunatus flavus]SEQ93461.1 glycerate kinase [Microlunatus flavus]